MSFAMSRTALAPSSFTGAKVTMPKASRRNVAMARRGALQTSAALKAVLFDCDGVILETEELHRLAYNRAFEQFNVKVGGEQLDWTKDRYAILVNTVAGGKPKMRWWFGKEGWPTSDVVPGVPSSEDEYSRLVDELQAYKTQAYKDIIASGGADTRPGVIQLMDDARAEGLKVAVCSAATKEACVFQLKQLLGMQRFAGLDCFLAGDDIEKKKPDPSIYIAAYENLGLKPDECVVIEDSLVGLKAAQGAGVECVITTTASTVDQDFTGAMKVVPEIGEGCTNLSAKELVAKFDNAVV